MRKATASIRMAAAGRAVSVVRRTEKLLWQGAVGGADGKLVREAMEIPMRILYAIVAAGAAVAVSAPAAAQDADEAAFTGPRIEGVLGYDMARAGSTVDNETDPSDDQSIDGVLYGVGIGYDFDFGGAVVGIEGEYTDGTAKTEINDGDFEGFGLGRVETGRDFYVGARAGARVSPRTLVYVKGGYTNARFNTLATDGTTELSQNFDTDGWRVGAGVEMMLSDRAYAKIEYRYSKYSEAEVDYESDLPDAPRFNIDTDRHQVVAAVGVRF